MKRQMDGLWLMHERSQKKERRDTQDEEENELTMSESVSLRDSVAMRQKSPVFIAASSPLITGVAHTHTEMTAK